MLVVNNVGVKYTRKQDTEHLVKVIQKHYQNTSVCEEKGILVPPSFGTMTTKSSPLFIDTPPMCSPIMIVHNQ